MCPLAFRFHLPPMAIRHLLTASYVFRSSYSGGRKSVSFSIRHSANIVSISSAIFNLVSSFGVADIVSINLPFVLLPRPRNDAGLGDLRHILSFCVEGCIHRVYGFAQQDAVKLPDSIVQSLTSLLASGKITVCPFRALGSPRNLGPSSISAMLE